MKISRDFYCLHKFFILAADVIFVNSIPFLVTFSRRIRLITVKHVSTRTAVQLDKYLINIFKVYARGGFVMRLFLMDMEFEKLRTRWAKWNSIPQLPESTWEKLKGRYAL